MLMFFQCLSFMALYGGVGSAWQTFCCSPVEEASALNQPGSIIPHSNAQCSLQHLGMGLGGQNFCSNLMEKIENVANLSPFRVSQRGMVYFSRNALCENSQKQIGNDTHPSRALRHLGGSLYWSALNQPWSITPHSNAQCSLRHLGMGFGGQNFCSNPIEKIETASFLISFGVMITLISYLGLFMLRRTTEYTRTRVKQRRWLGSGY